MFTSMKKLVLMLASSALALMIARTAAAASDLTLAPDLSFTDDSSANFPIRGGTLGAATIMPGRPAVIFFGTAHCWNTNREAERLVALYPRYRDRFAFVVVDLNAVAPGQQRLVADYYSGYIPTLAIFNARGELIYDKSGETASRRGDTSGLERLLESALR
jgi:hypothetical protein